MHRHGPARNALRGLGSGRLTGDGPDLARQSSLGLMTDERVRAAELDWRRSGEREAEVRWLVERVRAGAVRRLHLEWLAFLGDDGAAAALAQLEPRGREGKRPSARQRVDARESALEPRSRAVGAESELFWYTLVMEDSQAALRALLAAVELTSQDLDATAGLARLIFSPTSDPDAMPVPPSGRSPAIGRAYDFARHLLVARVADGDEALHDAMTAASRAVGRAATIDAARRALRAWWVDGEDLADRLAHGRT